MLAGGNLKIAKLTVMCIVHGVCRLKVDEA